MVRDDDGRPTFHQAFQSLRHQLLRRGIQSRRRLVENQDRRVAHDRPGDRDPPALTAGQGHAALAHHRGVALGHVHDEVMRVRQFGGVHGVLDRRVGFAVGDVLPDGPAEQQRVLQHEAHLVAQRLQREAANVQTVDLHVSRLGVEEARDETGDCRLACAGRPDDRRDLARLDPRADVFQYLRDAVVAERDMVEFDQTSEGRGLPRARQVPDAAFHLQELLDAFEADGRPRDGIGHLREIAHRLVRLAQVEEKDE